MNLPLFLGTPNRNGQKGATVRLFIGNWIIESNDLNTKLGLSLDGSDFQEINNLHRLEITKPTTAQLMVLDAGSESHITAFAGRIH